MITLFTGIPGAGKTASMIEFLRNLPGDRPLFVHYDPNSKTSPDQVLLAEGLKIPHTKIHGDNWPSEVPNGAIFVVDECQDCWRPRGSGSKVPPAIAAMETHRHRGVDILLTTQGPNLLDANVKALVGRHIHIRNTGIMGRWQYEWPEISSALQWKTCINKKRIRLPKKAFELYTSSSLHIAPVFGVPRMLIIAALLLVLSAFMIYGVVKMLRRFTVPDKPVPVATAPIQSSGLSSAQRPPVGQDRPLIDDRVDFIPRISHKPETAPAFDHLRVVMALPRVTGAACINDQCKCFTSQGTDSGLSSSECLTWAKSPPFNPYLVETPSAGSQSSGHPVPGQAATMTTSGVSSRAPV